MHRWLYKRCGKQQLAQPKLAAVVPGEHAAVSTLGPVVIEVSRASCLIRNSAAYHLVVLDPSPT
jgi:hypothetical protein